MRFSTHDSRTENSNRFMGIGVGGTIGVEDDSKGTIGLDSSLRSRDVVHSAAIGDQQPPLPAPITTNR
jgi:hypothetical protein